MSDSAQLVILFASGGIAEQWGAPLRRIAQSYPHATLVGCSSAGQILDQAVHDASIAGIALAFDHTRIHAARVGLDGEGTAAAAAKLAEQLQRPDLRYVLPLSGSLAFNGSELAATLHDLLPVMCW